MHLCPDTVDEHPKSDLNSAVISLNVTVPARRQASTLNLKGYSQLEWNKRETIIGLDTKVEYKIFLKNEKKKAQQNAQEHKVDGSCGSGMDASSSAPLCSLCVSLYMCLCALQWSAPLLMILPGFFSPHLDPV